MKSEIFSNFRQEVDSLGDEISILHSLVEILFAHTQDLNYEQRTLYALIFVITEKLNVVKQHYQKLEDKVYNKEL